MYVYANLLCIPPRCSVEINVLELGTKAKSILVRTLEF